MARFGIVFHAVFQLCCCATFCCATPIGLNASISGMPSAIDATRPTFAQLLGRKGSGKVLATSVAHTSTTRNSTLDRYAPSSSKVSKALHAVAKSNNPITLSSSSSEMWSYNVEHAQQEGAHQQGPLPFALYWLALSRHHQGAVPPATIARIGVSLIDAFRNRKGDVEFDVCCGPSEFDGILTPEHFVVVPKLLNNRLSDDEFEGKVRIVFRTNDKVRLEMDNKLLYLSPAQIKWHDIRYSNEADVVWSLGVILYGMLANKHPLEKLRQEGLRYNTNTEVVESRDNSQNEVAQSHDSRSDGVAELRNNSNHDEAVELHDNLGHDEFRKQVIRYLDKWEELPIPFDEETIPKHCFIDYDAEGPGCDTKAYDQLIDLIKHCLKIRKDDRIQLRVSLLRNLLAVIANSEEVPLQLKRHNGSI